MKLFASDSYVESSLASQLAKLLTYLRDFSKKLTKAMLINLLPFSAEQMNSVDFYFRLIAFKSLIK